MAVSRRGGRTQRRRLHLEALEPRLVLDASMLRITELVASNDDGITDVFGDSSDWFEIYNSGDELVNLAGMYLTDTAGNLTRFQIPSGVSLEGGGYMVVFATDRNGVQAGGELHTNFALSAGGEFLAIVDTNGTTIIDSYNFPAQFEDISYGVAMQEFGAPTTLLTAGAAAKAIRPTNSSLDNAWREVGYNDAAWPISGPTGLGYENNPGDTINYTSLIATPLPSGTATAYIRVKFNLASLDDIGRLKLRMKYDDGFAAYINGVPVAEANAPETLQWNSAAAGTHDDAASIVFQDFDISAAIPSLRIGENVLAIHALNQPTGSDMVIVPELVAQSMQLVEPETAGFFKVPTPGYGNGASVLGFAAEPTYTVPHGYYSTTQSVGIATTTPGAIIVYTTNGSTPQADANLNITNGTLYTGPISISSTTTLRARAFKTGFEPSFIEASSYIFVNDVINQSPAGQVPAGWAPNGVNGQEINYGIDPDIINLYGATAVKNSLLSLSTISITTDLANLFDPTTGIYVNANNRGNTWERPANVELITPAGSPDLGFEVNVGLRIRGGYSRNDFNPKHAFRFYFRSDYGDAKLNYALFGDEGASEFDVLDLRTEQNYSWSSSADVQNTFVREVFGRDTQRDMGSEYTRSRYHHLYVDGVYFGVFMTQERVEEFYSETYFGGDQDDYDIVKSGLGDVGGTEVSEGTDFYWRQLFDYGEALALNPPTNVNLYWTMQGRNPDGSRNLSLPVLLDAEQLADYMLILFFTGGYDSGLSRFLGDNAGNNWFGIYNRVAADEGFQFFIHDNEHSLGAESPTTHGTQNIDRTGPFNNGNQSNFAQFNPQYLHQDLLASPEYKQLFIDRVQKFMFNGGALTTAENVARFMERKNQVDAAIIAEAARWGDSKTGTPLNKANWQNEVNWVVNTYFPSRGNTVIAQLRDDGLYSALGMIPPTFSQHGGTVPNNYPLTIAASAGTIYYTTDGATDPRAIGGGVNPSAAVKQYTASVPISGETTVWARLRTAGGQWSGLVEAKFSTVTLPGDYNGSGGVDQSDYGIWKSSYGETVVPGSGADGNGNGVIDTADYAVWRDNVGTSLGLGGGAGAATEPLEAVETVASELPAADDAAQSSEPFFATADSLPSRSGATSSLTYFRSLGSPSSSFDNLLLAAARAASHSPDEVLDEAFDELASDFSLDFASPDDELLSVLAGDALGLPNLPF